MQNDGVSPLVEVRDVSVSAGGRTILDSVTFTVEAGETFGLLGGNGSGKTTTIRVLLGMLRATGGTATIRGTAFRPSGPIRVGYLPEERGIYRKERVIDVMTYFGELKGLGPREARRRSVAYLERVGIGDRAGVRIDRLSGGQQQKIQLGIATIDEPDLLILDEPAKGLDPVNRHLLMDLVAERRAQGAGVILVTHHMEEVDRLCDRILLLRNGIAAASGTVDDVRRRFGCSTMDEVFVELYGKAAA